MVASTPDGDVEIRIVDGLLFVRMPSLLGEKFFQVDPADTSNPLSELGTLLADVDESTFAGLEQAIVSFDRTGAPEDLNGVPVQPYTLVIDTTKIAPEVVAEMLPEGVAALPPTITYQYWIAEDDTVHKVVYEIGGTTSTMTFANFGAGAPVTAPPGRPGHDRDALLTDRDAGREPAPGMRDRRRVRPTRGTAPPRRRCRPVPRGG